MAKYIDENGLLYYDQKVKARLDDKVDKVDGKGLSTNDYTTEEKTKLTGIAEGAQVNVIESIELNGTTFTITDKKASATIEAGKIDTIKVNGTAQPIDSDKAVDITIPTKVSDLTNDSKFQTEDEVKTAIGDAIKDVSGIEYEIVSVLPDKGAGKKGTIYLIANSGSAPNIYDEYIFVNGDFEKIGTTEVNLTGYWAKADLVAITNAEIDDIVK